MPLLPGVSKRTTAATLLLAMLTLTTATSRLGDLPLDDEFRTEPIFNYEEPAPSGGVPLFFVSVQPYFIDCRLDSQKHRRSGQSPG